MPISNITNPGVEKPIATYWRPGDQVPTNGLLLIRHGPRPPTEDPPLSAELTTQGRRLCIQLGKQLSAHKPRAILASPFARCMDTADCIIRGAKWDIAVQPHNMLGDPGPFVRPADIATSTDPDVIRARKYHKWEPLLTRHIRGESIDGLTDRDIGTQQFCAQLLTRKSDCYKICISHHSIIAALMASLGLAAEPWPDFLAGAILRLK